MSVRSAASLSLRHFFDQFVFEDRLPQPFDHSAWHSFAPKQLSSLRTVWRAVYTALGEMGSRINSSQRTVFRYVNMDFWFWLFISCSWAVEFTAKVGGSRMIQECFQGQCLELGLTDTTEWWYSGLVLTSDFTLFLYETSDYLHARESAWPLPLQWSTDRLGIVAYSLDGL